MRISDQSLFISDLGRDFRPDALNNGNATGNMTTMAVKEESGGGHHHGRRRGRWR